MEEVNRQHKEASFGWVRLIQDFFEAGARARRDRAIATWGDGGEAEVWAPRPDQAYRLVRSAFAAPASGSGRSGPKVIA
jgi:hypothetical protein